MALLSLSLLLGALACALLLLWQRLVATPRSMLRKLHAQGIPGPGLGKLVVGHLPFIMSMKKDPTKAPLACNTHWRNEYGPVYVYAFGAEARLGLHDPQTVRQVLVTNAECYEKPAMMRASLGMILGEGLVTSEGAFWKRQRSLINPAFHVKCLRDMNDIMVKCTHSIATQWTERVMDALGAAKGSSTTAVEMDMHQEISSVTLDIIGTAAFGDNLVEKKDGQAFYRAVEHALQETVNLVLSGRLLIPLYMHLPLASNRKLKGDIERLRRVAIAAIAERRGGRSESRSTVARQDLLGLMLAASDDEGVASGVNGGAVGGAPAPAPAPAATVGAKGASRSGSAMSDEQLCDEALTFILAGHETTSQLCSWALYVLDRHPEWAKRLYNEVDTVLQGRDPTYDDLPQLKDLNMVLLETLRMYPPVPIIARECKREHELELPGGKRVKVYPGVGVGVPIYSIHHDPSLWPDPECFRPERFVDGVAKAVGPNRMAFVPFGAGPRICIGNNFALQEAKVILVMFFQRFTFSLSPNYRHQPDVAITMRPKYGLPMLVRQRNDCVQK